MSHIVSLESSAYECDWCDKPAKWKRMTKGTEGGRWGGGIYMRACSDHKSTLEQIKHRSKMGK